jgi:SAM-dependent methyltransferase
VRFSIPFLPSSLVYDAVEQMNPAINLQEWFGGLDIYLFDQLLKSRFVPGMRVLDAGCGAGRNLVYFLKSGYEVFGVDESGPQITQLRRMAAAVAPHLPAENFRVESVERLSADSADFDVVLSSAVLHFARDDEQWQAMVNANVARAKAWRDVLCSAGVDDWR